LVGAAVNVTFVPPHIVVVDAEILTAGVIGLEDTIAGVAQAALDVSSAVMISLFANDDEVYVELVAPPITVPFFFQAYTGEPPVLVGVAVNVTDVPPQIVLVVTAMLTVGVTAVFTAITSELEVTFVVVAHNALLVISQVILSKFEIAVVVKVGLFVPAFVPFFFHWYTGVVPPLVGTAVNVIEFPLQILILDAEMAIDGVTEVFTVIFTELEEAVVGVAQSALLVNTQDTASAFANVDEVNEEAFVPTFVPLIFHWYTGDPPPLVIEELNVTAVPLQIVVVAVLMLKVGVVAEVTVILIALEVAVVVVAQFTFDVNTQVTIDPVAKAFEEYVLLLVPTFAPFTFHW
jgi:hypothetical protein